MSEQTQHQLDPNSLEELKAFELEKEQQSAVVGGGGAFAKSATTNTSTVQTGKEISAARITRGRAIW